MRPGIATALALLCIPVLALAGQSARVGHRPAIGGCQPCAWLVHAASGVRGSGDGTGCAAARLCLGLAAYLAGRLLLRAPTLGTTAAAHDLTGAGGVVLIVRASRAGRARVACCCAEWCHPLGVVRRTTRLALGPGCWLWSVSVRAVCGVAHSLHDDSGRAFRRSGRRAVRGWSLLAVGVVLGTAWISAAGQCCTGSPAVLRRCWQRDDCRRTRGLAAGSSPPCSRV